MAGFSIVEFLSEQTVEVVPNNWVINPNACWWPTSSGPKLQRLLTNADSEPDLRKGMGVIYSAKVIKTYENYADAKRRLAVAEDTSCLETESDDESKKSRKERKRKLQEDFIDPCKKSSQQYEPDDSDEDSLSLLTDQTKKRKTLNANNVPFFDLPSSTPKRQENRSQLIMQTEMDTDSIFSTENMDLNGNFTPQKVVGSNVTKLGSGAGASCSCNIMFDKILDEIKNMKQEQSRFQEVIIKKITKIEGNMNEALRILGTKQCSPPVMDIPSFPVTTFEEVDNVEIWLTNADNVQILIQHFSSIGGAFVKDTTRRILSRIFSGDFCAGINWTGKNGKYALGKACLSKVIISSVRLCHPEANEKEVEDIIKAWFRFCKDRNGGREKRRQEAVNHQ